MKREELEKLAASFQTKADTAFQNYQETGISRYGSTARKNEDIADALRVAAGAMDEHQAYIGLKMEMTNFANRAQRIASTMDGKEKAELTEALIRDIVSCGRFRGLIS